MNPIERSISLLAVALFLACVGLVVVGENVLGVTAFLLAGAMYAYATTPHDGDERVR